MIKKVKKILTKLDADKLYSPEEVVKMGVVVNTKLESNVFFLYRLIKSKQIEAVSLGNKYFIKGVDLKKYLKATYKL